MRAKTLGLCVAVAAAVGLAAFVGGSAIQRAGTKPKAQLAHLPLQFAENYRGDGYRGVGSTVSFDRTGVALGPLRQTFVGARATTPEPARPTGTLVSYFRGAKSQWKTGLPGYSRLQYRNLWPGVDLAFDGTLSRLKYTFVLDKGSDPSTIQLAWRGATPRLLPNGSLRIGAALDEAPVAWQTIAGRRVPVEAAYTLDGGTVGFRLGAYDRTRPLTLDPSVAYAGFIGGTDAELGSAIAVDSSKAAYVAGWTLSDATVEGFPATGPDTTYGGGGRDAFLAKVKPDGSGFQYVTYIGGGGDDVANGVAVDSSGKAYVVGVTFSTETNGFPVLVGPDLTANGGQDAYVTVVNASGTGLVYSTFVGTSSYETGNAIAVDSAGNAYITGTASDPTFPAGLSGTTFDGSFGGIADAYVAKIHAGGTGFDYAGFIGGDGGEEGFGIAVDATGAAYVTGQTQTTNAPTFEPVGGPFLVSGGFQDGFVAKINPAATGFIYKGFLGGNQQDYGYGIAIDAAGNAYVTGLTFSNNFPWIGGFGTSVYGSNGDAFVAKIGPGGAPVYSGYVPGTSAGYGIAADAAGNAYVAGLTFNDATGFPAAGGPDSSYNGSGDGFALEVPTNPALPFVWATFIGGGGFDAARGIAIDSAGAAYVTGETWYSPSALMPAVIGPDTSFAGTAPEAFVEKIGDPPGPPPPPPMPTCKGPVVLVKPGESCTSTNDVFKSVTVKAGGTVTLTGVTVKGAVTGQSAKTIDITGGTIVTLNLSNGQGAGLIRLCGARVTGATTLTSNAAPSTIGGTSCAGNNLATFLANKNSGAVGAMGNAARSLVFTYNTGGIDVRNNTVSGLLRCLYNSAPVTGSGNTAHPKQAQCAGF